jgi:hypothetical protein
VCAEAEGSSPFATSTTTRRHDSQSRLTTSEGHGQIFSFATWPARSAALHGGAGDAERRTCHHRLVADGEPEGTDVVKTIGQLLGLAAGFVALVYAAGGGVLALRLYLAHLPSRTIVGQLPRDLLISVGLSQIVLPVLAVVALYAGYRLLSGETPPPKRLVREWTERSWRGWATLVGASAIPALVVAAVISLGAESERAGTTQFLWLDPVAKVSVIAFLLILLTVLVALNLRARLVRRYGMPESVWSTRRPLALMTLVVALASVPICLFLSGAFFPLLDAKVCTSRAEVAGVLIGETGDRTYIGQTGKPSGPLLIFSVPGGEITETFIGGNADARPCPETTSG